MNIQDAFRIAWWALRANLSRSILTTLGIVIGVASLVLVVSLGNGAENLILSQIRGLGSQTIIVEPGREPRGPSEFAEVFTDSLKNREVEALKNPGNVRGLLVVSPAVLQIASVSAGDESIRVSIFGSGSEFPDVMDLVPSHGSFFAEEDVKRASSVAIIGSKVKDDLFGPSDALGQTIRVKGRAFKVIGVFSPKGQVGILQADETIMVPVSTAQKYLFGLTHYNAIMIKAESEQIVPRAVQDITATLRELHNITDPDKDDFHIVTQAYVAQQVQSITGVLTALLGSIAGISLVVGGIGIMNIMLVSVTERTREIGLRKAVGAKNKDILTQFLTEAIVLTALGGVIGIAFGSLLSLIAGFVLSKAVSSDWSITIPFSAALLGLGVSAVIGLGFGVYPARRAAKKNPIEALRYE